MRLNRLLQIVMMLINKSDITVKYLAEQFDVSKKTIYRDLETLILSGIPVCYGENQQGYVSLLEGYSLKYALLPDGNNNRMIFDVEALGRMESFNPEKIRNDYSKAWKAFINYRAFDMSDLRQEILQSWTRCQSNNVPLYDMNIDNLVTPEEAQDYTLDNINEYQDVSYQTFSYIVKKLDLDITIYDEHAQLKYIININPKYEQLFPAIGYFKDVSEQVLGTNSTSLALIENRPCMVVGPEHYKKSFHKYSCAAAPIYYDNRLFGTINASFFHTSITTDTLNIVYSLARLFESLVLHKEQTKHLDSNIEEQIQNKEIVADTLTFDTIWGESNEWLETINIAKSLSNCDSTITLKGEPGVGKKTIAKCMHHDSTQRKYGPCIVFDCRSIPDELVEMTLFGYESIYTDSRNDKKGIIEKATGGTLILEHTYVLSTNIQERLSQFMLTGKIKRQGAIKYRKFDVRTIICMGQGEDNKILEPLKRQINRLIISVPPLRERKSDIITLAEKRTESFIKLKGYKRYDLRNLNQKLKGRQWNNNVTELFNILDKLLVIASSSQDRTEVDKMIMQFVDKEL